MTLFYLINDLFIEMHNNKIKIPKSKSMWGNLLLELKKEEIEKPDYIQNLKFDWDASYPICHEFDQIYSSIQSYHACPTRTDLVLDGEMVKTNEIDPNYLNHVLEKSKEYVSKLKE